MEVKKFVATLRKKNQITLKKVLIQDLDLKEGDNILFQQNSDQWNISKL